MSIEKHFLYFSFLYFYIFEESPEFYAAYKLINVKNHDIYNDNFTLCVVNLSRIDLATEEDKKYQIDCWARLFKATMWEEIHMPASENNDIAEASDTMFRLSAEESIRKRCLDREEYYRDIRTYKKIIREQEVCIAEKDSTIQELLARIEELETEGRKTP